MGIEFVKENEKKLIRGYPNTYTFTKSMAERMIKKRCSDGKVSIIRPSIVIRTYEEPFPGWAENLAAGGGITLTAGIGILLGGLAKLVGVMQQGAGKMTEAFGVFIEMIPGMVAGLIVGIIDGVLSMREAIFEGISKLVIMLLDFLIEMNGREVLRCRSFRIRGHQPRMPS